MSDSSNHVPDRLQTTDEHGHRVYVHPEDLKGRWKTRRIWFYWGLILLYMVLPWIYVDGKQWVRLDIPNREFSFFGSVFLGHDVPYLFFLLLGFVLFIAILTVVGGRLWCGWACPQTVFLETIFRKIEKFVEGDSRARRDLDKQPLNSKKFLKKSLKWFLFALVSTHITHSFLGYFVGTRELFWYTLHSPLEHWELFVTMLVINAIILFDFGWFREQFCIIMCPYGRLQSVIMDQNSLVVAYDSGRGEPRKHPQDDPAQRGDCVNCFQCVRVCPTGIDIRNGTQLECIACTACIDACDNIMDKLDKPRGLISYTTEEKLKGGQTKIVRPRLFVYLGILLALSGIFAFTIGQKDSLRMLILRGGNEPFRVADKGTPDELVVNHLSVEFYYQGKEDLALVFEVDSELYDRGLKLITPIVPFKFKKKGRSVANVFLKFPQEILRGGSYPTTFKVFNLDSKTKQKELILEKSLQLVGPYDN